MSIIGMMHVSADTISGMSGSPTGLLTNELEIPLNVEEPTFGWIVNSEDENVVQTAYEIVVTDDITGDTVWDSGKVKSSRQSYVPYGTEGETEPSDDWAVSLSDAVIDRNLLAQVTVSANEDIDGAAVFAAAYNQNGSLAGVALKTVEEKTSGASEIITFDDGITIPDNGSVKLFVWDSAEHIMPLSAVYEPLSDNGGESDIISQPLEAGHPYSWKVKTWTKSESSAETESDFSETAHFATGLNSADDWSAKWISDGSGGAEANVGTYDHYWYTGTSARLNGNVKAAYAYISGLQDYDLYINDTEIGRGQSFDYASESRYQGWDITDAVKKDEDQINVGTLIRTYGGGQGRAAVDAGFLAHINIFYTDGTVQTIVTDNTWKVSGNTPFAADRTKRNGEGDFVEKYDAQEAINFTGNNFDDSSWTAATEITADKIPTDTPIAELSKPTAELVSPVSVTRLSDGTTIADFGKVIPARPHIEFANGTAGTQIAIYGGYVLISDGKVDTSKYSSQSTDMRWVYTQKNGLQTYDAWDHLAFRYLQIPDCGEEFTAEKIGAKIVHTNVPEGRDSTFVTSNDTLNEVYEMMKRSSLYGIQNEFVDTPTREKGQFTDDARNISEAAMTTQFEREATRKALNQFMASADRYWTNSDGTPMGRYNSVYPNVDGKRDIPEYSVNFPQFVWNYYINTGDRATLEKAYPYIKATANYISENIGSSGLVEKLAGGDSNPNQYQYGIVDWPAAGRFGYDWSNCKNGAFTTVNMLSKHAFDVVALAAEELGKTADATDMQSRSDELKTTINEKLINSDGLYCDGLTSSGVQSAHVSQHANSYALAFDIADGETKTAAADYAASLGMKQGPMTADLLVKGLFNGEKDTAALKLLTEPNDYGWAKEIANGYTFTFESWDADSLANEDSQSHSWGATAASDILKNLAGVTVTKAGAEEVKIAPAYVDLTELDAQISTERGKVGVNYERSDTSYKITVTVPANVTARIELPDIGEGTYKRNGEAVERVMTVGSGTYEFVFDGTITPPEKIEYRTPAPNGIFGSDDPDTSTYTWTIGNSTDNLPTYSDTNDYADLTIGLGTGDSLSEYEGIKFGGTAVPDSGSVTDRYLLVEPKRDGTFTINVTGGGTSNNRVYYYDFENVAVDLSKCTKESGSIAKQLNPNTPTDVTINMKAEHKYVVYPYTNKGGGIISAISYKYTDTGSGEQVDNSIPYEEPESEKTVTEPSGTSITLNHDTYPLVVGNSSKTDFSRWEDMGSSFTLTAEVSDNTYTESNITWSIDDDSIAYIRDSKTSGASTSIRGKRTGATRAVASLPNGDKAVCYITVIDNVTRITAQTLEFNTDSLTLGVGGSAELIPIINPKDVYENGMLDSKIGWASSDDSVAIVNNGVVTAVGEGTAKIMAKTGDVGRKAYCNVTVTEGAGKSADKAAAQTVNMIVGGTQQLTADGGNLTWKSENTLIADVDETGAVTAYSNSNKPKVENGVTVFDNGGTVYEQDSVNIYATAPDGSVQTFPVTVADKEITASGVSIYIDNPVVVSGQTKEISAAILPANAVGKTVNWSSSNTAVAEIAENGKTVYGVPKATITAKSAGTTEITAECDGKSDKITITVTNGEIKVSDINIQPVSIDIDEVYELETTVTDNAANKELEYISTDNDVLTVNNEGIIKGYKAGTVKVYAIALDSVADTNTNTLKALIETRTIDDDNAELTEFLNEVTYSVAEITVKDSSPYLRNLHAPSEAVTDNSVNLLWNRASLMDIEDFVGYNVYCNNEKIADNITTLGYTVNGLEAGQQYTFKVEAVKSDGTAVEESITVTTDAASTVINVTDKGAIGDGKHMDTSAIQKAIDDCPDGGTVLLPEGKIFVSGALYLKSDITFKVDGILLGSPYDKDYPATITRWEGWRRLYQTQAEWGANAGTDGLNENVYPHASLINAGTYDEGTAGHTGAYNMRNITICGKGQINANGFRLGYNEGLNQKTGNGGQPEPMTPAMNPTVRGRAITLHNVDGAYLKDVTVAYSPSWTIHPVFSRNITVDGVDVVSAGDGKTGAADDITILNGDGIDPDSSIIVNLFNMDFETGDDGVAIKTGKDKEGNELMKPCAYIRVTDCYSHDSKGGIVLGSENASGTHDTLFQNLKVGDTTLNHTIWFKGCWSRGGVTENILIRDIDGIDKFDIQTTYNTPTNNPADTVPVYRYITFENCNVSFTAVGFNHSISGLSSEGKQRPETYLENFTIRGCQRGGNIDYAKDFTIWDPEKESNWSIGSHTDKINFAYSDSETNTKIKVKDGAQYVSSIDNDSLTIVAASGASGDNIINDIEPLISGSNLTFEVSADGKILTVTAPDGRTAVEYTILYAKTWDFSTFTDEVKMTTDGIAEPDYDGLKISLAGNGNDSDHDKITTDGVYWRGGASSGNSVRYIAYTPDKNGTLTATGKLNSSGGRWGISNSLDVSSFIDDGSSSTSTSETTVSLHCNAGTTYYIMPKAKSASVYSISYISD